MNNSSNTDKKSTSLFQGGSTLLGFILGLSLGLVIALVVAWMINRNAPHEKLNARMPDQAVIPKSVDNSTEPKDINSPLKSKVSKSEESDTSKEAKEVPTSVSYWVQIGAYSTKSDAENQKATVAMQGVQAVVSDNNSEDKKLWRVRIGPFESSAGTKDIKKKLDDANIGYTVIKVNK